ncbi:MAG: gliding motility-associated C-terminal domain-containing protein [Bacteroidota bacterium]
MNFTTKTCLAILLLALTYNTIFGANIAIIESRSHHPFHTMDQRWQQIANQQGHTSNIYEQSVLNTIDSISSADILIISSGLIEISADRQAVIRQFIQQGGSVYIQSEYLMTNPGNLTFEALVAELGSNFRWEGQTEGSLAPMKVDRDQLGNETPVSSLDYFWYGTYGSGDKNILPFLEFDRKNYGFIYCPSNPTYGKIMTISDQDWIRSFVNPTLLNSLLQYLSATLALDELPSIQINADNNPSCLGQNVNFIASLNQASSNVSYQWFVNDQPVANSDQSFFSSNTLEKGDEVKCQLLLIHECGRHNTFSNTITVERAYPIAIPRLNILTSQASACQGEEISFTAESLGTESATDLEFIWTINGQTTHTGTSFSSNNLNDGDIIGLQLTYSDDCSDDNQVVGPNIQMTISPRIIPTIDIMVSHDQICEGEFVTFSANGTDWGNQPVLQWNVDGQPVLFNETVFTTNTLRDGQQVSCSVLSNELCALNQSIESNTITVDIQQPLTPMVSIASNQMYICEGNQITLIASGINLGTQPTYIWNVNGQLTQTTEPILTIPSIVKGTQISLAARSSERCLSQDMAQSNVIDIEISQPEIQILEMDGNHCGQNNGMIEIEATKGDQPFTYEWSNGQSGNFLTDLASGQYEVTATDANGCYARLTIEIEDINGPIITGIETTATDCDNSNGSASVAVKGNSDHYQFTWRRDSGHLVSREANATQLTAGTYYLEIEDEYGCTSFDTVSLENAGDIWFDVEAPQTIELGNSTEINITTDLNRQIAFEWLADESISCTDCDNPTVSPVNTTTYSITGINEAGCSLTKELTIRVLPVHEVYIPNAFSPNGDGQNDYFTAFSGQQVRKINYLRVFDRWGGTLFEKNNFDSNQEAEGWDGSFKGQTLKTGVYIYTFEIEFIDGHKEVISGDVSIMP